MEGSRLRDVLTTRRYFNPNSKQDISEAKKFFKESKWEGCPFYLEWPYLSIPDMIKDKITRLYLK